MTSLGSFDTYLKGDTGRSARTLLRTIILLTIAAAAISSRLFSVIRKFKESGGKASSSTYSHLGAC